MQIVWLPPGNVSYIENTGQGSISALKNLDHGGIGDLSHVCNSIYMQCERAPV